MTTPAELTEEQREQRRTRARTTIETAIANAPHAETATPAELADIALDSLGELAAEILVDGTMMRSLTIKDGAATLELAEATEMVRIFAAGMRGCLDGHGASNYVEMEMTDGATGQGYTVTVQRRECPTPHQFRQQAEARVVELTAELEETRAATVARQVLGTTTEQPVVEAPVRVGRCTVMFEGGGRCEKDADHRAGRWSDDPHTPEPAKQSVAEPLKPTEREFLTFALDLAADRMASRDGFTDEDHAALDRFRRLADETQQPAPAVTEETVAEADRIVAYRNTDRPDVLLCREHGDGWMGLTPLTSEDLPDGGLCTWGDCGRDVLA